MRLGEPAVEDDDEHRDANPVVASAMEGLSALELQVLLSRSENDEKLHERRILLRQQRRD